MNGHPPAPPAKPARLPVAPVTRAPPSSQPHTQPPAGTDTPPPPIPDSVVRWLFDVIQPLYTADPRATFHDTMVALTHWRSLRPRTRVHTAAAGTSQLLLCLWGELGGVPVQLWVPAAYPRQPPTVYVDLEAVAQGTAGTPRRRLLPSDTVAGDGEVHWQQGPWDPERCNIAQVVAAVEQLAPGLLAPVAAQPMGSGRGGVTSPTPTLETTAPPLPPKPTGERPPMPLPVRPPQPIARASPATAPTTSTSPAPDLLSLDAAPDAAHSALLADLHTALASLATEDAARLAAEDTANTQRYTDVANQFRANLAHQQAGVRHTAEQARQQRAQLTAALAALERFEQERLRGGSPPSPASVVGTANDTLYALVSLDAALSDAVQLCSRLLDGGALPVDQFVRQTRLLATRQFQVRDALARASVSA